MYHFCFVYIYTLNGYQVLNSFEEFCITWVETGNSFARVHRPEIQCHRMSFSTYIIQTQIYMLCLRHCFLFIYIYIYIYIYICICICLYACVCVCVSVCMRAFMSVCLCKNEVSSNLFQFQTTNYIVLTEK